MSKYSAKIFGILLLIQTGMGLSQIPLEIALHKDIVDILYAVLVTSFGLILGVFLII